MLSEHSEPARKSVKTMFDFFVPVLASNTNMGGS